MDFSEFQDQYLSHLNSQQQDAVLAVDGPVLLLATPGSGKTTVLVLRLGYMTCCLGIDPRSILTLTYTRAATQDMRIRFASLFGEDLALRLSFRTINGISSGIISHYAVRTGREAFSLLSNEGDRSRILREAWQRVHEEYPEDSVIRDFSTTVTYIKNMMLTEEEIIACKTTIPRLPELYHAYQDRLRSGRLMDYDDQLVFALRLLERSPELLQSIQARYRYFSVDEAQDTSKIQHRIIQLLAGRYENLFMVGDEDQSIYGFRAAFPDALMSFEQDHPGAKVLLIEENYRSTPEIIGAANSFVKRNRFRHEKCIVSTRPSGAPIEFVPIGSRAGQYDYLLRQAPTWERETAILFRNNDSALPLIDRFEQAGIPYNCRDFDDVFFSNRVVCDILDTLRFAELPCDAELFLRLYYKFGAGITKKAALWAVKQSGTTGKPILISLLSSPDLKESSREAVAALNRNLSGLPGDSAENAIQRIWETMHYGRYVEKHGMDSGKYFILCELARKLPDVICFRQKLEKLRETISMHQNLPGTPVLLSTIHSSKGLEYDRVYLLDMLDGILPSRLRENARTDEEIRQYEEDRRLFYVAVTRAKNELVIFLCKGQDSFPGELAKAISIQGIKKIRAAIRSAQKATIKPLVRRAASDFSVGDAIRHRSFGNGTVREIRGDTLTIDFEAKGCRQLSLSTSLQYGLLEKR